MQLDAVLRCATLLTFAALALGAGPLPAAEPESTVVWYTTMNDQDLQRTVTAFNRRYPAIHVATLRMGSAQLPARVITEQRAGTFNADVLSGDDFQMSQLVAASALDPFRVPDPRKFLPNTSDPDGRWTTLYMNTTVIAWNTQRLKADKLAPPSSVADLAQPQWKGKLGLDGSALNWYLGVVQTRKDGDDVLHRIAANAPIITLGHTVTVTQLETGEFDATPTAYGYLAEAERRAGKPVDYINPRPLLVSLNPAGLAHRAPHPNAARILLSWLLSKAGQQFLAAGAGGGEISARTDVTSDPRIWNPKAPFAIVPALDASRYNAAVHDFKTIFGIPI